MMKPSSMWSLSTHLSDPVLNSYALAYLLGLQHAFCLSHFLSTKLLTMSTQEMEGFSKAPHKLICAPKCMSLGFLESLQAHLATPTFTLPF